MAETTWNEILTIARRQIGELSEAHYSTDVLRDYGLWGQRTMAAAAPMFFLANRPFMTTTGTAEYSLNTNIGPDVGRVWHVTYDGYDLGYIGEYEIYHKDIPSSIPGSWYRRQDTVGYYPTPPTAATGMVYFSRIPPRWAMSLNHDGSASSTAATYLVSGIYMVLTITGGTNAGTDTFSFSSGSATVQALVSGINALAKGFTATKSGDVRADEPTTYLENVSSTSCYTATVNLYENPEVPNEYRESMVCAVTSKALWEGGEYEAAKTHKEEWDGYLGMSVRESNARMREYTQTFLRPGYGSGGLYTNKAGTLNVFIP